MRRSNPIATKRSDLLLMLAVGSMLIRPSLTLRPRRSTCIPEMDGSPPSPLTSGRKPVFRGCFFSGGSWLRSNGRCHGRGSGLKGSRISVLLQMQIQCSHSGIASPAVCKEVFRYRVPRLAGGTLLSQGGSPYRKRSQFGARDAIADVDLGSRPDLAKRALPGFSLGTFFADGEGIASST